MAIEHTHSELYEYVRMHEYYVSICRLNTRNHKSNMKMASILIIMDIVLAYYVVHVVYVLCMHECEIHWILPSDMAFCATYEIHKSLLFKYSKYETEKREHISKIIGRVK